MHIFLSQYRPSLPVSDRWRPFIHGLSLKLIANNIANMLTALDVTDACSKKRCFLAIVSPRYTLKFQVGNSRPDISALRAQPLHTIPLIDPSITAIYLGPNQEKPFKMK